MPSHFFNNEIGNTLFDKFHGIVQTDGGMGINFHTFQAVTGYFRSSGYFKLRKELVHTKKIQILVGINIDDIYRKHDKTKFFIGDQDSARKLYTEDFIRDVQQAGYKQEIEEGILQLCDDFLSGRLEMRIHASKNLHAKFYLCLPEKHTEHSDGWVIMGSSNLTDSGLGITQAPRYELNVAMKDYDDVAYCKEEFERLWNDGVPLTKDDIVSAQKATHLKQEITPFELYMKVLIDTFGEQAEDNFSMALPDGFMDLKYQHDAVIQGYQMLCKHNGFFLADVVGLGKTVIAAMIAKRFLEANGRFTNILVIYPPAVEQNWKETFRKFTLHRKTQFVSNGSLSKVLEEDGYKPKEDYDLIIVDESHNFRNDTNSKYDELQRICKAPRANKGLLPGTQKKVILISATALNNRPGDLLNQILLFQDKNRCTIDNISNLPNYFAPHIQKFNQVMRERKTGSKGGQKEIDKLYSAIQKDVLEKITVRRTRTNILNDPTYKADMDKQHIVFPKVSPPKICRYKMDIALQNLFWDTYLKLQKDIQYARYRAIEFLVPPYSDKYRNPGQVADILASVYRVHMVKRLESSFSAFKKSLDTFIKIIDDMLKMFDENKVLIIPDFNISKYLEKNWELDKIIHYAIEQRGYTKEDIVYPAAAFKPEFIEKLKSDKTILQQMATIWHGVDVDPKFDEFMSLLNGELFDKKLNPSGKLTIFSESVDTIQYLEKKLKTHLKRNDILCVDSKNRSALRQKIMACFDANSDKQSNEYNILLTSDVLAEGINLHRANIIINYDSPWNASRLMQRIGRVNRIGSSADEIHNYMFYPSEEGNKVIGLSEDSLFKMQGFHSALGEDIQIYSPEEIVKEFELFDKQVKDTVDENLRYLRIVRDFHTKSPHEYARIKALPPKSRVVRSGKSSESVAFISSSYKTSFFLVNDGKAKSVDFLTIAKKLEAESDEKGIPFESIDRSKHYKDVQAALNAFKSESEEAVTQTSNINHVTQNKTGATALSFLRKFIRGWSSMPTELSTKVNAIMESVNNGVYTHLERRLFNLSQEMKGKPIDEQWLHRVEDEVNDLYETYLAVQDTAQKRDPETDPLIVVTETFVSGE